VAYKINKIKLKVEGIKINLIKVKIELTWVKRKDLILKKIIFKIGMS